MRCPCPTPSPPDPPGHLPGEGWVAEPSQAQPSRRVTQAAAEAGDSPRRDISAERPLCQPGLHKWHGAAGTAGLSPVPFPADTPLCTSHWRPAHIPAVWQPDRRGVTDSHHSEHPGHTIEGGNFQLPSQSRTPWGGGSGQEASGGRQETRRDDGAVCAPCVGQEGGGGSPAW